MGSKRRTTSDTSTDSTAQRLTSETREGQLTYADVGENAEWLIRIEDIDRVPDELELDIDPSMEISTVTDDHPAVLQIRVTNLAASEQAVEGGHIGVSVIESATGNPGLLLIAPHEEYESQADCWQPVESVSEDTAADQIRLTPGKPNESRFKIWGHHANAECLPEGIYRFELSYQVYLDSRRDLNWGFRLRVIRR